MDVYVHVYVCICVCMRMCIVVPYSKSTYTEMGNNPKFKVHHQLLANGTNETHCNFLLLIFSFPPYNPPELLNFFVVFPASLAVW